MVRTEKPVHHRRARLEHRLQLVSVHEFGHRRSAMADQLRYLLDRHISVGQQRHERMAQLTWRPIVGGQPWHQAECPTKVTANIRGIHRCAERCGEHEARVEPPITSGQAFRSLLSPLPAQGLDAKFGKSKGALGLLVLVSPPSRTDRHTSR